MDSTSISRLALCVSVAGLAVATCSLLTGKDQPRRGVRSTEPDSRATTEESARRDPALAAEIEALRRDLASLRQAMNQRSPGPQAAEDGWTGREPLARSGGAPGEFEVRSTLLARFDQLERGDRDDAIERLGELARWGDEDAKAVIVASLDDESATVRARALKELARLDEANLSAHLNQTITDPSGKVREVVASLLDDLPAAESGPMLVGLLHDPDADVVIEAIQSLGDLEYAGARPALVEQLDSESLDVATHAARALIELGDAAAARGTIERIMADYVREDVSGRIDDVKRLRRLHAVAPLERILASDASLAVREAASAALVSLEE